MVHKLQAIIISETELSNIQLSKKNIDKTKIYKVYRIETRINSLGKDSRLYDVKVIIYDKKEKLLVARNLILKGDD